MKQYVKQVAGTSIGALNARLFLVRSYKDAEQIWCNIKRYKIAP